MKKLFLFLSVFALLFSCEPEMVQPQKKGNVQNPNGDVGSANAVMQSVLPEAIYISKYSQLFAVDATTGDSYVLVPDNANYAAMASPNNGYIYGTRPLTPAPDDNYLFKVDPLNENSFEDGATNPAPRDWDASDAMVALGSYIYIAEGSVIYKVYDDGNSWITFSTTGNWSGTEAMTAINGHVYVAKQGGLFKINDGAWGYATVVGSGFSGVAAMTAGRVGLTNYLFMVQGGTLYRVTLSGTKTTFGAPTGWNDTKGMIYYGGHLFIVDGDTLYRVNATNGSTTALTSNWTGTNSITVRGN